MAEFGLKKDPLMKKPVAAPSRPSLQTRTVEIHKNLIPVKNIQKIRKENFGYTLFNKNTVTLITDEAHNIIEQCNNKNTLEEIQNTSGGRALNFIYSLYQKGFICFNLPEGQSASAPKEKKSRCLDE